MMKGLPSVAAAETASGEEAKGGSMVRADPPEVTTIRGDEGTKFQTFRNGHNGSIYEPEKLVGAKKLGRALQVSQRQVPHGDLPSGEGLGKSRLHRRAQPFPNEISRLGDHRDGD